MIPSLKWVPLGACSTVPLRYELTAEEERQILEAGPAADGEQGDGEDVEMDNVEEQEVDDDSKPKGHMFFKSNEEDELMTSKKKFGSRGLDMFEDDEADLESLSDMDDYIIKDTDRVLLVGVGGEEEDKYAVEVQVFDTEELNIYVHHDFNLPEMPLVLEWVGYDARAKDSAAANFVAVGTMNPGIEIWNADVVDVLEPSIILGGHKDSEESSEASEELVDGSHSDSVLALSWSKLAPYQLLSGAADSLIKLWDLNTASCASTWNFHGEKVQALSRNFAEVNVVASGGADKLVCLFDVRVNDGKGVLTAKAPGEVENLVWNPFNPAVMGISTDNGFFQFYDVRQMKLSNKALFEFQPHSEGVTAVAFNPKVENILVTASIDNCVKIWDLKGEKPELLASKDMNVGALFTVEYHPDSAFVLACAGSGGIVAIWDTEENDTVAQRCSLA